MMMDLQKRPPQYPSLFGASHDPRAAPQPPPTYSVPPPQQAYYDSLNQHGVSSSQPANTVAYSYSAPISSVPPTPTSSTPYDMAAPLRADNHSYQVPQMNYELPKKPDPGQKNYNKRHRRSHSRNNSHDQLIYREGPQDQSLGTRRMPPPSPPQHYASRGQSGNSSLPAPFMSREPPNNLVHHRPGSSMPISSMLGSDADRPARDVGSASIYSRAPVSSGPYGSAPPPSAPSAMSPPTAPARPSTLDYPMFRRSKTPEKSFSKNQPGRPYRSGAGSVSHGPPGPEQSKFAGLSRGQPPTQFPDKPSSSHASPQFQSASTEPSYHESRRLSFNGPVPRPNSQPQHLERSTRSAGYSPLSRPAPAPGAGDHSLGSAHQRAASYVGPESQHSRFGNLYGDRLAEEQAHRDRERAAAHEAESKASHPQSRYGPHYGDRDATGTRHSGASAWDFSRSQPPSPEAKRFPAPEPGSAFGFGAIQNYTKSLGLQPGGSRQPSLSMQPRQNQPAPSNEQQSYPNKRQTEPRLFSSAPSGGPASMIHSASDDQRRKGSDELLHHRNLLGVGLDAKRGGRASPLPQAVQGAQAQLLGPAGEAGIKSELGRVFSGIGSGVGGVTAATAGSGPSTPMTVSPFKRDSIAGRSTNSEATLDDPKTNRPASTTGKRSRKSRDEDSKADSEPGADRLGASVIGRRGRHVHHHHHHHHHHRLKPEDDNAAAAGASHRPASSMNFFNRTSTPAEAAASTSTGHHHHHHHNHHHHTSRPTASTANLAAMSPMHEPRTVVTVEPVVSSVAHLPRHHLGSTLYTPRIGIPSQKATLESAKFGYTTTPLPIPRFEGKENCTFTIRVPRFRIDTGRREEICARRALWGTGIYTDDSDPVAAAIHSGFFRGAWGEEIDVDMLDLEIREAYQHAPKTAEDMGLTGDRPRIPPVPPTDKDLHITLLVLPKLERYESSILFGLKSRSWDSNHDGMSFKVLRVEWVDEGVGRGEERGGEARRKRLRNLMQSGRICTGPGVIKLDQLRSGIQVPRRKTGGMDKPEVSAPVQTVS